MYTVLKLRAKAHQQVHPDGKQALVLAAANAFVFATHLRCANHLKDNVTDQLQKQLPENVIKEIIFGNSSEKGLVHATNKEFDDNWDNLEKAAFKWFASNVAPVICDNMRSELLQDLQIEDEKDTQNNSESLNALVKRYVPRYFAIRQ